MKKSRKRHNRRDRRIAKQSEWRRQGKPSGGIVGHGPRGSFGVNHAATKGPSRKRKKRTDATID